MSPENHGASQEQPQATTRAWERGARAVKNKMVFLHARRLRRWLVLVQQLVCRAYSRLCQPKLRESYVLRVDFTSKHKYILLLLLGVMRVQARPCGDCPHYLGRGLHQVSLHGLDLSFQVGNGVD